MISFFLVIIIVGVVLSGFFASLLFWGFGISKIKTSGIFAFSSIIFFTFSLFLKMSYDIEFEHLRVVHGITALWVVFIVYAIGLLVCGFIYFYIKYYMNKQRYEHEFLELKKQLLTKKMLLASCAVLLYGIIATHFPVVNNFEVHVDNLPKYWEEKKIVLVSDTHYGLWWGRSDALRLTKLINKQKPYIVMFLGDIIDGPLINVPYVLEPLSYTIAPGGIFYIEGNHETYSNSIQKKQVEDFFASFSRVLLDDFSVVSGLQIVGYRYINDLGKLLSYENRVKRFEISSKELYKERGIRNAKVSLDAPTLALVHDPSQSIHLFSTQHAVFSGHTHCGQMFPFTVLTWYKYKSMLSGKSKTEKRIQVTSCGFGTSVLPVRILTQPDIIVITLKSVNN